MATFTFQKAVKAQEKLRLALDGPPGSGKTYTALQIGCWLAAKEGGRVAGIDSERSSMRKYAGMFDFDHLTLPDSDPRTYIDAIKAAQEAGYSVLIVDSLSHAWEGTLDMKDAVAKRSKSNDSFGAWREVTPVHNELVDGMLRFPGHVIATMRTKMEFLVERNDNTGKNQVSKIGLKPVQRDGVDYEFDVVADMDQENTFTVTKSRCFDLAGAVIRKPGTDVAQALWDWLQDGEPLVTGEQAEKLREIFRNIPDQDDRGKAQRTFVASFAKPAEVAAGQFDEALAFAFELSGVSDAPVEDGADDGFGEPGPTEPPATGADAPTPSSTAAEAAPDGRDGAELMMDLEAAIKGLPTARQQLCREELRKTFGELTAMSDEDLLGALDVVRTFPIGPEPIHTADPASLPGAAEPPLSAKQRATISYGRSANLGREQLVALASLLYETTEPRPIHELNDMGCLEVQRMVDRVGAGEIVFRQPNGVLIAKEAVNSGA